MDHQDQAEERFPWQYAAIFAVLALGLIIAGVVLWVPERGGPSTARSDLGLTLLGGGLALTAGFGVGFMIFDRALRRRDEAAELENVKLTLSMTADLRGINLRGRNLRGMSVWTKNLQNADLRGANLSGATFGEVNLSDARLNNADLRAATFTTGRNHLAINSLYGADLRGADLRGATVHAEIRTAILDGADLRGADLSQARAVHPHPQDASDEEVAREAAHFVGAKYDADTRWPTGVDPDAVGAVRM